MEKSEDADQTTTQLRTLEFDERVDEIARMVSGDTITEEARAAARALLEA